MKVLFVIFSVVVLNIGFGQQFVHDSLIVGGNYRSFYAYIPASYNASQQVPLVLSFHGYGSSAAVNYQYTQFHAIADTAGFIVVHPQGSLLNGTTHWNVGGWTIGSTVDDVNFTNVLLDYIESNYTIDSDRIYSTGMSNGGYMSFKLACELNERFAAIASVTGSMTPQILNTCNPVHPTPILQIHGTADATVPYAGSPSWTLSIEDVLNYWVQKNNCNSSPELTSIPDISTSDGSTVDYFVYGNGIDASTVEHFRVNGGDHDWPGVWGNMDIDASKEVWRFFYKTTKSTSALGIVDFTEDSNKSLVKIIDFTGKEIKEGSNSPSIYIFNDGTTKKVISPY